MYAICIHDTGRPPLVKGEKYKILAICESSFELDINTPFRTFPTKLFKVDNETKLQLLTQERQRWIDEEIIVNEELDKAIEKKRILHVRIKAVEQEMQNILSPQTT